ncbi:paraneoplastic antigen Ma1 homolog [Elgaria multicarinata webbii]|uniref:paraneoplastic antigen Ma1 homolog n=1 Tax=Elgaria multicarinata webbii TaxID=159646 RepID=UPI002FCD1BC1
MAVQFLEDWCKGLNIDPLKAILVTQIAEGCDEDVIKEKVCDVEALSQCQVRGLFYRREDKAYAALVEVQAWGTLEIPHMISTSYGEWKLVIYRTFPPNQDVEFLKKLKDFLEREGKSIPDVEGLLQPPTLTTATEATASTIAVIEAMGKMLGKVLQPHPEATPYRRLRIFSGRNPPGPGEEEYGAWIQHVKVMMQDWQVPEAEKRRRLTESLRGPALEVVHSLMTTDPRVDVQACLDALEYTFGSMESAKDLLCRFHTTMQKEGEKLSVYVQRLEKILQQLIRKGGLTPGQMDKERVAQVLKGTLCDELLLVNIRMREQQEEPPTFSQLMKEIREEEEKQAIKAACRRKGPTRSASSPSAVSFPTMANEPPAELDEPVAVFQSVERSSGLKVQKGTQRRDLQGPKPAPPATPQGRGGKTFFCYKCGNDGHIAIRCRNEENSTLVLQQLRSTWENQGNEN